MSAERLCPRDCLQEIVPYQPGKPVDEVKREFGLTRVIKLASNENPLGASPAVASALRAAHKHISVYPDGSCYYLRQALSKRLAVKPEQILFGNGSSELLTQLGVAFLTPDDEVLTSQMTFVTYPTVARLMGAELVQTPMRDFTYDLDALAAALTPRTRIVFIANPNNPTGTTVDADALLRFIDQVPEKCLVVLDEAYVEYADPGRMPDSLAWVRSGRPNVAVLRTFSKCYGLAGLRVGYGVAPLEVAQALERVRDPFNVNSLAQAAALAALGDQAHVRRSVSLARSERRWLHRQLTGLGLAPVESQANFVFARVPSEDGQALFNGLLQQGIIIRPFPGPYVRITTGTRVQNEKLIKAIKKSL